ncbi:cytochrome d ubiquinol oxidase subunit II [Falsiroseomonas selenitidurans]|uniref:Cytochrome d ubiquinol oxidase subunit II n=1 Tax=Falsiroseomonas selenitidurans TaxID=2716335 RepID=A0ABX1E4M9_9PROT|nr:cytochrome d ubiquinol oxidase subunit II [Falsiroseomonas selenitidurans]NKC32131.1 cytochrome d ubiquinol oxidase subunit II [Falsiroseomonas selenitidurans]
MTPFLPGEWLPLVFAALMAVAILAYVVLDGFDLGVGILLETAAEEPDRDRMIAAIGPFWDANETWLVLGVGLLLVAFPIAHGMILTALYLPVALMLVALTLRGVAFEFRAKAADKPAKRRWDRWFFAGSLAAALSQGWMLGRYVLGFAQGWAATGFALMAAIGLALAYAFIGACWLVWRTEGALQAHAILWARRALWPVGLGILLVSAVTPLVSARIAARWFDWPEMLLLAPLPLLTVALLAGLYRLLARMPLQGDAWHQAPFWGATGLFVLFFAGLAWSFFPYVVPERLTIWESASAPESLSIILVGALVVLPVILLYTVFAWRVFGGKARDLTYY